MDSFEDYPGYGRGAPTYYSQYGQPMPQPTSNYPPNNPFSPLPLPPSSDDITRRYDEQRRHGFDSDPQARRYPDDASFTRELMQMPPPLSPLPTLLNSGDTGSGRMAEVDNQTMSLHSTISKDETGGMEAMERKLLEVLTSKYNFKDSTRPQQPTIVYTPQRFSTFPTPPAEYLRRDFQPAQRDNYYVPGMTSNLSRYPERRADEGDLNSSFKPFKVNSKVDIQPGEIRLPREAQLDKISVQPKPRIISPQHSQQISQTVTESLSRQSSAVQPATGVRNPTERPESVARCSSRSASFADGQTGHQNESLKMVISETSGTVTSFTPQGSENATHGDNYERVGDMTEPLGMPQPLYRPVSAGSSKVEYSPRNISLQNHSWQATMEDQNRWRSRPAFDPFNQTPRTVYYRELPPGEDMASSKVPEHTHQSNDTYAGISGAQQPAHHPISSPPILQPLEHRGGVDWHIILCDLFKVLPETADESLLSILNGRTTEAIPLIQQAPKSTLSDDYHTIHRVYCAQDRYRTLYLDAPWTAKSGPGYSHLRGGTEVENMDLHIERHKNISFLVYIDYNCCDDTSTSGERAKQGQNEEVGDVLSHKRGESVCIISEDFADALNELAVEEIDGYYPDFEALKEFSAPYLWFYHQRESFQTTRRSLPALTQTHIKAFAEYIDSSFGEEYSTVDGLISRGMISSKFLSYLFTPDSVVLFADPGSRPRPNAAYLATSWLVDSNTTSYSSYSNENLEGMRVLKLGGAERRLNLRTSTWSFDGSFQNDTMTLLLDCDNDSVEPFKITDLNFYPLKFAKPGVEENLRQQGETFWNCRRRCYVCCSDEKQISGTNEGDQRYMIDINIYNKIHPNKMAHNAPNRDDLGPEAMDSEHPPRGNFTLLLPGTLVGFNMQEKKWVDLNVAQISPVKWNKKAFESLVVDEDTKILITALVSNQITAKQSTDLISGKGNGLIVLLHGGPGTGKTLTAESVAEIAERPLYRVTCGDIGTNPEAVEKFCIWVKFGDVVSSDNLDLLRGIANRLSVVLLDEADVFLEQRTLADLQRNALVSVFLRVLEYYDGILVLTSNRVGTFDEAFKSRIQLSLRYENLTEEQRLKVWENFIDRLESFEPPPTNAAAGHTEVNRGISRSSSLNTIAGSSLHQVTLPQPAINISELREHLRDLAKYKMNGRQIRNAVTTARQLALYKEIPMGYAELKHVIGVASKFDAYLLEVHENLDGDAIARDSGDR